MQEILHEQKPIMEHIRMDPSEGDNHLLREWDHMFEDVKYLVKCSTDLATNFRLEPELLDLKLWLAECDVMLNMERGENDFDKIRVTYIQLQVKVKVSEVHLYPFTFIQHA